eukprot:TRINITY_DN9323_c0_g1_i4.p1 TRINITY_DN9323_c0_g1~~TRINITY_DN9323_c0_g1_i4.p1  ORF type:complete len:266 (-),score=52.06 TRINITY_DN9323_c0_g1_i4:99-896(-)
MSYKNKTISSLGTFEYRVFFTDSQGNFVSPIHDIPLWVDQTAGIARMVVEIPKGTHPKLEMAVGEALNPIKQDVKKGQLRKIHDAYPFNYGAFPQTFEAPDFFDERTQALGDHDPIDVCEISDTIYNTGDVIEVKILGVWAMIDEGETDWKVLAINTANPDAAKYNDASDVPEDIVRRVFTFLRDYKIPAGSGPNKFAFDSQLKDKAFALTVVDETHHQWKAIATGSKPAQSDKFTMSTLSTVFEGVHRVSQQEAADLFAAKSSQ